MDLSQAKKAHAAVGMAVRDGRLTRPDICELCGCSAEFSTKLWSIFSGRHNTRHKLEGHHYNGYDNPLDVWWLCRKCNYALAGRHDGSLTREQAKQIVGTYSKLNDFKKACGISVLIASKYPNNTDLIGYKEIGDFILANASKPLSVKDIWEYAIKIHGES